MYNVPLPVSVLRTRIREEFERHRFAKKLPVVDVLIFKSDAEYQVRAPPPARPCPAVPLCRSHETSIGRREKEGFSARSARQNRREEVAPVLGSQFGWADAQISETS